MKSLFTVTFTQMIEVELDEAKFTPEFMVEYRRFFYPFDTVDQHAAFIGQLMARDMLGDTVEGYGRRADMGIKARVIGTETDAKRGGAS